MATRDVNIAITASDKTGSAFSSVQRSLGGLKSATSSVTSAIGGLSAAFAAIGATAFIKNTIDAADSLNKLAQKTGIAVDTLSALANSADLAGVSQEQLGSSLTKLNKSIAEAVSGSREQIDAFAGLGIAVKDANGNIRSTDSVLADIADRFARASDGATKTQYAMALFGKSGADLIPFLNQGSEGLKQFGASIGADFAKQAEIFNDNITKIGQRLQRFIATEGTGFLEWSNKITSVIANAGFASLFTGTPVQKAAQELVSLNADLTRYKQQLDKSVEPGKIEFWQKKIDDLIPRVDAAKEKFKELYKAERGEFPSAAGAGRGTVNPEVVSPTKKDLPALPNKEVIDSLQKAKDELNKLINGETEMKVLQFQRLGASKSQVAEYRKIVQQNEILISQDKQLEEAGKQIDDLFKKRADLEKEVKKTLEESLDPLGKMNLEMAKYASWRSQGLITAEQEFQLLDELFSKTQEFNQTIKTQGFGAAMERGMKAYYNSIKDISGLMEDSVVRAFMGMEDAIVEFVKTGKLNFTDLANSIISDMIRIQVRQSITEPLSKAIGGGGISSIFSNLFGMSGSQSPAPVVDRSFAGGGYTGSGARSGGIDGMGGFPAILHPNETVIDHSAGQSSGVTVNQTINLSAGVSQTVRAEVMGMMPRIMEATKSAVADAKRRGGSFGRAMA